MLHSIGFTVAGKPAPKPTRKSVVQVESVIPACAVSNAGWWGRRGRRQHTGRATGALQGRAAEGYRLLRQAEQLWGYL